MQRVGALMDDDPPILAQPVGQDAVPGVDRVHERRTVLEQAVRESPSPVTNGAALVETESKDTVQEAATAEGTLMLQADDMSLLRDAEKQARARAGEALPAAASALAPRKEKYRYCDEETRESAASWYECIAELRAQGLADAASAELGALQEAFPDFRQPARSEQRDPLRAREQAGLPPERGTGYRAQVLVLPRLIP